MTTQLLTQILSWVLPPVLGAIIGYVTNYLAIKMLFRPLTVKKIFNIRLPFTPGIIPKQRHVLADSIGNMVSKRLLTPDAFNEHLNSAHFHESLKLHISSLTHSLLDKPLSLLKNDKVSLFLEFTENFILKTLNRLLNSDKVRNGLSGVVQEIVSSFMNKNAYEILGSLKLKKIISAYVLPFVRGPKVQKWLEKEFCSWTGNLLKKNTPLEEIIPSDFIDNAFNSFKLFLPELIKALFLWLRTEETRTTLEQQGRELIKNIFKKMNLFQQFFVSVAQYDKTLTEKMPAIVEDTLLSFESAARDVSNQMHFIESAKKAIQSWLKKGMFDIFYNEAIDIDDKVRSIIETLFSVLKTKKTEEYILKQIDDFIEQSKEKTLKEFLNAQTGIREEDVIESIRAYCLELISKKETIEKLSQTLTRLVISLISNLEEQPVADLLGLDNKSKQGIDNFLFEKILQVIRLKLPDIITGLNVKALVVNKINSLDIESVERLLLMVISQHLRWINVFGAILGAMIGFIQVIVNKILL